MEKKQILLQSGQLQILKANRVFLVNLSTHPVPTHPSFINVQMGNQFSHGSMSVERMLQSIWKANNWIEFVFEVEFPECV